MKLFIPIKIQERIDFIVNSDCNLINLTQKQKISLKKTLISLWFYIYESQRGDDKVYNLKGFVNIHKTQLSKFRVNLNKSQYGYSKLLELLEFDGLIEINKPYSIGRFTTSYRIKTDLLNGDYTEVEIDFDKVFSYIKNKKYWTRKYPELTSRINDLYQIKIDLSGYIKWLNDNKGMKLKPIIKDGVVQERILTDERIFDYINDSLKVNYENIWVKVSNEGRFYNSTTNLSYTALPFLKLRRRGLKEIDVSNCQPLLLCKLIKHKEYQNDVEAGTFYQNMAEELEIEKDSFKLLSFKLIFFSNKELKSGKVYDALEKLYPGFIGKLNELRKEKEIAKELQKIESDIFVNKIGSLDFNMMLRHDAVFVYEEDYDIVRNLLIKEFKNIGLKVSIKNK